MGKTEKNDVGPAVFDGDISVTQKARDNRCTLLLGKSGLGSADDNDERMFVAYSSVVRQMPACRIDTDKGDDEGIALASACPLARLSSTSTGVRLAISNSHTYWKQDGHAVYIKPNVLRVQLTQLSMGHSSANPESY